MKVACVEGLNALIRRTQGTGRWSVFWLAMAFCPGLFGASFLDTNTVRFPLPVENHLDSIAVGNGVSVATGERSDGILVSRNGEDWSFLPFSQIYTLRSVAFGNDRFVIVGGRHFFWSDDGITWHVQSGMVENLAYVMYSRGSFWAVGDNKVFRSNNGEDWLGTVVEDEPTTLSLTTIFDDGTLLHAIGDDPPSGIYTPDSRFISLDGVTWTKKNDDPDVGLRNAVVLATDGNVIAATALSDPPSHYSRPQSLLIMQDANGDASAILPPISVSHWSAVKYHDGRFWFFSDQGIVSSDADFIKWTIEKGAIDQATIIAVENGWLAATSLGEIKFRSYDAEANDSWDILHSPDKENLELVDSAFGNDLFLAMERQQGENGTLLRSFNGRDWERLSSEITVYGDLTFVRDRFIVLRESSTNHPTEANPLQSVDGTEWTTMEIRTGARIFSVAGGSDLWIALSRAIRTSPVGVFLSSDGSSWEEQDYALASTEEEVVFGNGVFVTTNLITADGIEWKTHQPVRNLRFYEGEFFGFDGVAVFSSSDGLYWKYSGNSIDDHQIVDVAKLNGRTIILVKYADRWRYRSRVDNSLWVSNLPFFPDGSNYSDFHQMTIGFGTVLALGSYPSLIMQSGSAFFPSRLANLSARTTAGSGDATQIAGFVIEGSDPTRILARGIGPSLSDFNVGNPIADPMLRLVGDTGEIARNDNWADESQAEKEAAFTEVGAFQVAPGSLDAALVEELAAGRYTAHVVNQVAGTGVALAEIYQLGTDQPLKNLSCRTYVDAGEEAAIGGLVVSGLGIAKFLIRAVGPGLADYGVEGVLSDPVLQVHRGNALVATNQGWYGPSQAHLVEAASETVGAFLLTPGSADSALVIDLPPGNYTASVRGANGTEGIALLEIYLIEQAPTPH